MFLRAVAVLSITSFVATISAQQFNPENITAIKDFAKTNAESIINDFYKYVPAGSPTGLFYSKPVELNGGELIWEQSAVVWDSIIAYSNLTGDTQFNDVVADALYAQMGDDQDFVPKNQTNLGPTAFWNQNQSEWALVALSAAELSFPKPVSGKPTFIELAQNVFNAQAARWDNSTCDGDILNYFFPQEEDTLGS